MLKIEGARQASSPSLCVSVRAVAWADEAEQQLSRLALSGCELSADVGIFGAGLLEAPCTDRKSTFEVGGGKTIKQPQSLCLFPSSAMGRCRRATAFQASSFCLRAICRRSRFCSRAAGGPKHRPQNYV